MDIHVFRKLWVALESLFPMDNKTGTSMHIYPYISTFLVLIPKHAGKLIKFHGWCFKGLKKYPVATINCLVLTVLHLLKALCRKASGNMITNLGPV